MGLVAVWPWLKILAAGCVVVGGVVVVGFCPNKLGVFEGVVPVDGVVAGVVVVGLVVICCAFMLLKTPPVVVVVGAPNIPPVVDGVVVAG